MQIYKIIFSELPDFFACKFLIIKVLKYLPLSAKANK